MRRIVPSLLLVALFSGCDDPPAPPGTPIPVQTPVEEAARNPLDFQSLADAKAGFQTRLIRRESDGTPIPAPPSEVAEIVEYAGPLGTMRAYLTRPPIEGAKHPAIIWITGGDCNSIGDFVFEPAEPDNDQTAAAFREAGIITMYPSLRGGNDSPGVRECFLGEVDDVLAARTYLASHPAVDARRIYLGGHSTGGTLVLLAAASTGEFRAVFSFGPAGVIAGYGPEFMPFEQGNLWELQLRSPGYWVHAIQSPTFVFEGMVDGNVLDLRQLSRAASNPLAKFYPVRGADHFSVLAPVTALIAERINADRGETTSIDFDPGELNALFGE